MRTTVITMATATFYIVAGSWAFRRLVWRLDR